MTNPPSPEASRTRVGTTLGTSLMVELSDVQDMAARPSVLSDETVPPAGSALLAIDRFALTSNNLSYAASAEELGHWSHFPAVDGKGHIPAWGNVTVLRSAHPDVDEGARFYGLVPMATHLLVAPTDVGPRGFTDRSPQRASAAPVYRRYLDRSTDPIAAASPSEAVEVLLRPLFTAAFLLEADLADNRWFGADAIVVASASSRTALGMAHLLHRRRSRPALIGLTREDHVADVRELGCYDRVLPYEEAESLPSGPTALVDLSGDGSVVSTVHRRLGQDLVHSAIVGATHRGAPPVDVSTLPGAPRTFFYAPSVAERLRGRVGDAAVERALTAAWRDFATDMQDWLVLHDLGDGDAPPTQSPDDGAEATIRDLYARTAAGQVSPREGWVLSLRSSGR